MKHSRRALPALMLRALGLALIVAAAGAAPASADVPAQVTGTELVSGKAFSADLKSADAGSSQERVIVFLSSKCPCSRSHEPKLAALAREFTARGVEFIGIHANQDETEAEARLHFKEAALPFPVVRDTGARLANAFGALKTPHAYILRGNEIVYQGGVDSSAMADEAKSFYLRDALLAVEQGRKPEPGMTRCLGCMIKRN